MASISPATRVAFRDGEVDKLAFPPPVGADSFVCVHPGALKAPQNGLTLVLSLANQEVTWVGAVDEQMLSDQDSKADTDPRALLAKHICAGNRLWQVVSPGLLTSPNAPRPVHTVYDGERPWVILGELPTGSAIAAPLNDATGNPKWWAPQVAPPTLDIPNAKPSQIELAHLWAIEPTGPVTGKVDETDGLRDAVTSYFRG